MKCLYLISHLMHLFQTYLTQFERFISRSASHASFENSLSRMWDKPERHLSIQAIIPSIVISSSFHKQRSSPAPLVCLLARHDIATQALQACSSTQNRYTQQVDYCIKLLLVSCVCFCEVLLACNDDCNVCTTSE